jgi:hypothetical protein
VWWKLSGDCAGQALTERSGRRLAIVQSSYIPWKGYFDLIRSVDEFILLDEVQFTRRDWRSRNRVKTQHGIKWLSLPVSTKGKYHQRIDQTFVSDPSWGDRHWSTLRASYGRTPGFREYQTMLEPLFRAPASLQLSAINRSLIEAVCAILRIDTRISWSSDYAARPGRTERLIDLCLQAGASEYLSGPAARVYLDADALASAGVQVRFVDYAGYPEYDQPYPPFEHHVSVLDLIFCAGPRAVEYMKLL